TQVLRNEYGLHAPDPPCASSDVGGPPPSARGKVLSEALAAWDRKAAQVRIEQAERLRQEIVKEFPLDGWTSLPLDRYALGLPNSKDGFCYILESGSTELGSTKGASAIKHVIYKEMGKPGWYL